MILPPDTKLFNFATHPDLFKSLDPLNPSWFGWNTLFKVYDRSPLNSQESDFYYKVTGGLEYSPKDPRPQNWLIVVGRGGGKTRNIYSRIGPYRSFTFNSRRHPGLLARNIILSPNLDAGMEGFNYTETMLRQHPKLWAQLIAERPSGELIIKNSQMARMTFRNGTQIRIAGVSRTAGAGKGTYTLILEEAAKFKLEGRFSDEELYTGARPGMVRFGMDAMCFVITSPMTKEGLVWKRYKKYFGIKNGLWLVIQGASQDFNPTISDEFLRHELEELGEDRFKREYLGQFIDSITGAFPSDLVDDGIVPDRKELPYNADYEYFGFIDAATLSISSNTKFNDEYVAGVGHIDPQKGKIVEDKLIAWSAIKDEKRYTWEDATAEAIELFRSYRVKDIEGDRFGSGYIQHKFETAGFKFTPCQYRTSDIYLISLPMLSNHSVELLDEPIATSQLKALERKRGRDGKDRIEHMRDRHDDRATVRCGLIVMGKERMAKASIRSLDLTPALQQIGEGRRYKDHIAGNTRTAYRYGFGGGGSKNFGR